MKRLTAWLMVAGMVLCNSTAPCSAEVVRRGMDDLIEGAWIPVEKAGQPDPAAPVIGHLKGVQRAIQGAIRARGAGQPRVVAPGGAIAEIIERNGERVQGGFVDIPVPPPAPAGGNQLMWHPAPDEERAPQEDPTEEEPPVEAPNPPPDPEMAPQQDPTQVILGWGWMSDPDNPHDYSQANVIVDMGDWIANIWIFDKHGTAADGLYDRLKSGELDGVELREAIQEAKDNGAVGADGVVDLTKAPKLAGLLGVQPESGAVVKIQELT